MIFDASADCAVYRIIIGFSNPAWIALNWVERDLAILEELAPLLIVDATRLCENGCVDYFAGLLQTVDDILDVFNTMAICIHKKLHSS